MSGFTSLGIPDDLVAVLSSVFITEPTAIQAAVIPAMLEGTDVMAQAPTGSGKTLAFGLPLLLSVASAEPQRPRGLVLAPTRELAEQIKRDLDGLARAAGRVVAAVYGGVPMAPQIKAAHAADVIIATPGRLTDLIDQGELSLDKVDRVVIDEADRMADMGFLPSVSQLLDLTNPGRQTVLFSATLDRAVEALTHDYQQSPVRVEVGSTDPDLSLMTHHFVQTTSAKKIELAARLIDQMGSTLMFCRTRHGVDRACRELKSAGVKTGWIHGGRTQRQRDSALMAFTDGRVKALVATDVAARGIHVDNVACVIHYDPPAEANDYVHRSGRTARAGASGTVVTFVNQAQTEMVMQMLDEIGLEAEIGLPDEIEGAGEEHEKTKKKTEKKRKPPTKSTRSGKPRPRNRKKSGAKSVGAAPRKRPRKGRSPNKIRRKGGRR